MIKGIIVEGCDCSGKSTLVATLKTTLCDFGWDVMDLGHREGNQFDRYIKTYVDMDRIVLDRGHFSEIVYGDAWRGGNHFTPWERIFLDNFALEKFIIIFAHVSDDVLRTRYQARSFKQIISLDELSLIQFKFAQILNHPKVLQYDSCHKDNLDKIIKEVVMILEKSGMKKILVKPEN